MLLFAVFKILIKHNLGFFQVVIMLVFILIVFGLCWMPLQVAMLYSEYKPLADTVRRFQSIQSQWCYCITYFLPSSSYFSPFFQLWEGYEDFYYIAQVLAFSNSAINPLLYAGFNDNFRKGTILNLSLSILQITE